MWSSEDDFETRQAFASSQIAARRIYFLWPMDNLKKPFKSDKSFPNCSTLIRWKAIEYYFKVDYLFDLNGKALELLTEEFVFSKSKPLQLQSVNWKSKITEIENYFRNSNLLFLMCEFVIYIGIETKEMAGLNPLQNSISSPR
ncbi:hypothetical protein CEXT_143231 [Caerostris extrusa]|uniref:Uncharacterized protein n=1 Tax=Caerostris extrusa TaxID=172846 RepID=A0AAV4M9T9_CAEEX|nr:hypothetical protein CEXT_143231 [Caerostris extrusa]